MKKDVLKQGFDIEDIVTTFFVRIISESATEMLF